MSLVLDPERLVEIARSIPWIEGVSSGDDAPSCQWHSTNPARDCDRPAAWTTRIRCCGWQMLACAPCLDKAVGDYRSWAKRDGVVAVCRRCGHEFPAPRSIEDVYRLVRL